MGQPPTIEVVCTFSLRRFTVFSLSMQRLYFLREQRSNGYAFVDTVEKINGPDLDESTVHLANEANTLRIIERVAEDTEEIQYQTTMSGICP
jgi:hypothetical protein